MKPTWSFSIYLEFSESFDTQIQNFKYRKLLIYSIIAYVPTAHGSFPCIRHQTMSEALLKCQALRKQE